MKISEIFPIKSKSAYGTFLGLLLLSIGLMIIVSTVIGAVSIEPETIWKIIVNRLTHHAFYSADWESKTESIIWTIRLPRVFLSFIVGAGLAVSGILMQALTRNPLADPYVLGISSGASTGAVLVIIFGWFAFLGNYSIMFGASVGALISIIISMKAAAMNGKITSTQLVLAGIATSALFSAVTNLIIYGGYTDSDKTKTALYWMVGSLSGATAEKTFYVLLVFLLCLFITFMLHKNLDLLLLGDESAAVLGMEIRKIKIAIILLATVLTGVIVSVSGVIGFIGLVIPHITRMLVGTAHKRLIPAAVLTGGLFAIIADVISRVLVAPIELPIGVVSAFFGAPFFLLLIRHNRHSFH